MPPTALRMALAALALVTTACGSVPAPTTAALRGTVHLDQGQFGGPGSTGFTAQSAAGRTLNLYASNAGWNGNPGSSAFYTSGLPVASATVAPDLSYTLDAPLTLDQGLTSPITEFWPGSEFDGNAWVCAPSIEEVSAPGMRFVVGVPRVMAGGELGQDQNVLFQGSLVTSAQGLDMVRRGLLFVDRPGTVRLAYDCTSSYLFRQVIDVRLDLQRGWNVLETRDVQQWTTDPQWTTYTTILRALPLDAFQQDLYWESVTVHF